MADVKTKQHVDNPIWIVRGGHSPQIDPVGLDDFAAGGAVKEYHISDLGCYLLNPQPIEIKKRLIGCEIHYAPGIGQKIRSKFARILPLRGNRRAGRPSHPPEVLVSTCKLHLPVLKDPDLFEHLNAVYEHLRSYDLPAKRLQALDLQKVVQIIGICEDVGGHMSYLKLQGRMADRVRYLINHLARDVGVLLKRAYVADGLFELRGFDFSQFDSTRSHRLWSFSKDGQHRACVLSADREIAFWVDDHQFFKFMLLLEHSIKANPGLKNAFQECIRGTARPVKLFFNKSLEIDYSKSQFPLIFTEVLKNHNLGLQQRNLIKPSLNYLQTGISFSYLPRSDSGESRLLTQISVMHDLRALEILRKNLPQVYSEISKLAFTSEAGRFYLLDTIEGQSHA